MIGRVLGWLADPARTQSRRPATRMTEADALVIARAALVARKAPYSDTIPLLVCDVSREDDELVWHIASMTRGSGVSISISDVDGRVIKTLTRSSR